MTQAIQIKDIFEQRAVSVSRVLDLAGQLRERQVETLKPGISYNKDGRKEYTVTFDDARAKISPKSEHYLAPFSMSEEEFLAVYEHVKGLESREDRRLAAKLEIADRCLSNARDYVADESSGRPLQKWIR